MSKLDVPGPLLQGGQPWGDVHPSDDDETSHDDSKVTILAVEHVSLVVNQTPMMIFS